jgi:hypothetical protein
MKKEYEQFTLYLPDPDNPTGEWIGVLSGSPDEIPCPFEIRLRYSERGELQCAGLRIGEGTDWRPKSNITSRMLVALPLGAVLRYILEHENSPEIDPEIRRRLANAFPLELALPPEGRSVVPGAKRKDEFYISQAELFARYCVPGPRGNAEAYGRIAAETGWEESTVRRHVQRGWELRPDLKPDGIRIRRPTEYQKPREES